MHQSLPIMTALQLKQTDGYMDTCTGLLHGTFDDKFTEHSNGFGKVNVQLIIQIVPFIVLLSTTVATGCPGG